MHHHGHQLIRMGRRNPLQAAPHTGIERLRALCARDLAPVLSGPHPLNDGIVLSRAEPVFTAIPVAQKYLVQIGVNTRSQPQMLRQRGGGLMRPLHLCHVNRLDRLCFQAARRNGLEKPEITDNAIKQLERAPWPGNVRELRNLCEAVAILTDGPKLDAQDFSAVAADAARPPRDGDFFALPTLEEFRAATEREFIRRKLEENGGNIKRTAERISIQRSNLYKKLDRYGLK